MPNNIRELTASCDNLFRSMKNKDIGYEFISLGSLYYFFGTIFNNNLYLNNTSDMKKSQQKILQFKNVLSLIENNYSTTITLEDLSKTVGMTPKYFCRFFYNMSNKTPIEYLNFYRIERACYELITTDLSVTEVALNCGFNDISYFIKTFKKLKKITPKAYKQCIG